MSRPSSATDIVGRRVRVDVPATSANLGAGFDSLALALDLANRIEVEALPPGSDPDVLVQVVGEGAGQLPTGRRNHFVVSLLAGLAAAGLDASTLGWRIRMDNRIPISRGLGSLGLGDGRGPGGRRRTSSTAPWGGSASWSWRLVTRATRTTPPPPSTVASAWRRSPTGRPLAVRLEPPAGLLAALYVPDRHLSTSAMRAALPDRVPFGDAVHNVGAAALAVAALSEGRLDLLSAATVDRLHEPYRAAVYPELPELLAAARAAGATGACLSGAGSTVIAFSQDPAAAATIASAMERRALALEPDRSGARPGRASRGRSRRGGGRARLDPSGPPARVESRHVPTHRPEIRRLVARRRRAHPPRRRPHRA